MKAVFFSALLGTALAHLRILYPPNRGSEGPDEGFNPDTHEEDPCGGFNAAEDPVEIPLNDGEIQIVPSQPNFILTITLSAADSGSFDIEFIPEREVKDEPLLRFEYETLGIDPGDYVMQFHMEGENEGAYFCSDVTVVDGEVEIPNIPDEVMDFANEKLEEQGKEPLEDLHDDHDHEGHDHDDDDDEEDEDNDSTPSVETDSASTVTLSLSTLFVALFGVLA